MEVNQGRTQIQDHAWITTSPKPWDGQDFLFSSRLETSPKAYFSVYMLIQSKSYHKAKAKG